MLDSSLQYVFFDFETTGLDVEKDEPIQIGLIKTTHQWDIIDSFQSYIKPEKSRKDLKAIVWFMTWIALDQLESAPWCEELSSRIFSFFDDRTVCVWHNIWFDIHFLEKYFPWAVYHSSIDTYERSQILLHYMKSYALEALTTYVEKTHHLSHQKKHVLLEQLSHHDNQSEHHDALYDSVNSYTLFFFLIEYLDELMSLYPALLGIVSQSPDIWLSCYMLPNTAQRLATQLPVLEKVLVTPSKPAYSAIDLDQPTLSLGESWSRVDVHDLSLIDFLTVAASQQPVIISFSHTQKVTIAKRLLEKVWYTGIGSLQWRRFFDVTVVQEFLQKGSFSIEEVQFLLVYFSHHQQHHSLIQCKRDADRRIYQYLTTAERFERSSLIVTSHDELYQFVESHDNALPDHTMLVCDSDRWYTTYNKYHHKPINLYDVLYYFDYLVYKLGDDQTNRTTYRDRFVIAMGVFFVECNDIFRGKKANQLPHDPIIGHDNFARTSIALTGLDEELQQLFSWWESWPSVDWLFEEFPHLWSRMMRMFHSLVNIQSRIFGSSHFYVLSSQIKYTDRSEFTAHFDTRAVHYVSCFDQWSFSSSIRKIPKVSAVIHFVRDHIESEPVIFVLSADKQRSQELFSQLVAQKMQTTHLLIAENITGGHGKSLLQMQQSWPKVIIGSFQFLLKVNAQQLRIDKVINFHIMWPLSQLILHDVAYYAAP